MRKECLTSWEKYTESTRYLAQGSSTSSKIPAFTNIEPAQIVKGKGCRVWDADGNEYIDFRNGLGPVTLGYAVPEINQAIAEQMENGIIFGHPHPLEGRVAKLLTEVIPCAERARFLKTGGEAVSACIKIARNATNRSKIVHCGYNGWLNNLCMGGFRPAGIQNSVPCSGVPAEVSALHQALPWADVDAWQAVFAKEGDQIAAVVIACQYADMDKGKEFLPAIRELTRKYGTLMIMDEIVTGFRVALGGAQDYFNFVPDMAVFSKGIANGMPISAYVGKAELIESAKTLGISSTFGGETLSLAAAEATINFYKKNNVINHLWTTGQKMWSRVNDLFQKHGLPFQTAGLPVCPQFQFDSTDSALGFMKACYHNGVSLYNVSYVNYSHKDADIDEACSRIEKAILEFKN